MIHEDLVGLAQEGKKFDIGIADPAWSYSDVKVGGSHKSGAAQHYPTMTLREIADLPVKDIMEKNSLMFLWVTAPLSYEIARSGIVEKWGFKFTTKLFWEKEGRILMGRWYRGQIEECWLLKRGNLKPFNLSSKNIVHSKPRGHSQKPDEMFELIEKEADKFHLDRRIELFARGVPRPGWRAVGNEVIK